MVFIFLIGVSIFSYCLGIFIEILYSYSLLMNDIDDEDRLQGFFNTLRSYNNGKRINIKLQNRIEKFFHYKWSNDHLQAIDEKYEK